MAYEIMERLNRYGYQAYLVGGTVRDILLGRNPKDYDIVTDALPEQVLTLFPDAKLVGESFGVVLVNGCDVATMRLDSKTSDGRRPDSVQYTVSMYDDSLRRDFTINAIYARYRVYDFHGGRRDLTAKIIRCVGDPVTRFHEDYLRMLRAVRFAAQLEFTIEPETYKAICDMHEEIKKIAPERIRDELVKILMSDKPSHGIHLLKETGMLDCILPEVSRLDTVQQCKDYHPEGDVFTHTMIVLDRVPKHLRLAALLHDVGKAVESPNHEYYPVGDILRRLKFDNATIDYVTFIVENHMRAHRFFEMKKSKQRRLMADERFIDLATFETCDDMLNRGIGTAMIVEHSTYEPEEIGPEPLVRGQDLIDMGLEPGPQFKVMLDHVYDLQLEGVVTTKKEGLDELKRHYCI